MTTSLVILWHMHQPAYADPATGEFALPWTRLHAVKDYDEFADVLSEHPTVHTTVNLTPVLCEQLEALGRGVKDVYESLTEKPAAYLTELEREFILSNFFKANVETMIKPYERYAELFFERGRDAPAARIHEAAKMFSVEKMRDLQVWANLAWCGLTLRQTDPVVTELLAKGRHFTEEEKLALIEVHRRVCAGVLDKYRRLQEAGIVEISSTPYYHPILPLLLDMKDAQVAHPGLVLPKETRPFPEDARWHVESSLAYCERVFGARPVGMWPAEGSVSEKACDLLASCGVRWAATDENILARSLNGSGKMTPQSPQKVYRLDTPHGPIRLFFRNHELSDRIGFAYYGMPSGDAVADFLGRVRAAPHGEEGSVVSVILDGENAWEYYQTASCRPFLTDLFSALAKSDIPTRTCGSFALGGSDAEAVLTQLSPGSWINANFNIWIGHPEDNAGWDAVQLVRQAVEKMPPSESRDKAIRLLRITEGSDWYWWFGDDHSSMDDPMFDRLFRENLMTICKLAGAVMPTEILYPIKRGQGILHTKPTTETFTPSIDGRIRPFYEWLGAARVDVSFAAGAMHKAVYYLEELYWGFDESHMYFCMDLSNVPAGADIRMEFRTDGSEYIATLPTDPKSRLGRLRGDGRECSIPSAFGDVLETAIPLSVLNVESGARILASFTVMSGTVELERWPSGKHLEIVVPEAAFYSSQWMV